MVKKFKQIKNDLGKDVYRLGKLIIAAFFTTCITVIATDSASSIGQIPAMIRQMEALETTMIMLNGKIEKFDKYDARLGIHDIQIGQHEKRLDRVETQNNQGKL